MAAKFPEYESFNLQDINREMQDKWEREKTFEKSIEKRKIRIKILNSYKLGRIPHQKGKTKENYLPLKKLSIKLKGIPKSKEHKKKLSLMAKGKIIADGDTKKVLTNQYLVEKSSLVLPQTRQFAVKLRDIDIKCPDNIFSKDEMINFLANYLKTKLTEV